MMEYPVSRAWASLVFGESLHGERAACVGMVEIIAGIGRDSKAAAVVFPIASYWYHGCCMPACYAGSVVHGGEEVGKALQVCCFFCWISPDHGKV